MKQQHDFGGRSLMLLIVDDRDDIRAPLFNRLLALRGYKRLGSMRQGATASGVAGTEISCVNISISMPGHGPGMAVVCS